MTGVDVSEATAPPHPTFLVALRWWARLGCVGFGGPAGQIALMHDELVERRRWISEARFLHALDYCMLLPGPEAQQLAIHLGWLLHRTAGGVIAGTLFVLPSLVLLIALSWLYVAFGDAVAVAGVFHGIKPAVTALVAHAGYRIAKRALPDGRAKVIAVVAFVAVAVAVADAPFPLVVAAAALVGRLLRPGGTVAASAPTAPSTSARYVIDDATPVPARFAWRRFARVCATFGALWAMPFALVVALCGIDAAPTRMALFFTKAALLTFGGAYVVLPYVYQAAVEHFHWLTAAQMIDGLALGETTPGPLIIVVAFVGFVGGWADAVFGPGARVAAGVFAACVVAYFTFLPSFFLVLAGGPAIEAAHGVAWLKAPLAGVTAAVVGVIASLATFFAAHVLWPQGPHGPFDAIAAVIGLVAAVALFRYRVGAIPVIIACGAAGACTASFLR